ncbi:MULTISPECIES: hypothetical protein [Pseudomonas aeruginosa group]|uniref:hypothetical protein n=1 Tax=Pseudomonas aeruginosa group TaxID=136841 RepID=UPI000F51B0C4|nr:MULTISPECIES: hypothetical protein [Pseudomonas aeruginosa group]MDT1023390.1 hypothetical protein [Pseudomonas paraeruginosa]QQV49274.1 hypothetical protein JHW37_02770 [Pseudomonas aeruginosa]
MSLFSQLEELQWKQLQHDEKYHKDIWLLNVQQRITHMTLHLAKYSAKLSVSAFENNEIEFKKTIVDCLIIVFSSANIFNSRIYDISLNEQEKDFPDIKSLANYLANSERIKSSNDRLGDFSKAFSIQTGIMCKAAESLDHLEPFPFRQTITESLGKLFKTSLTALYCLTDQDLESLFSERLVAVERKNIFFNRLGNYETGY